MSGLLTQSNLFPSALNDTVTTRSCVLNCPCPIVAAKGSVAKLTPSEEYRLETQGMHHVADIKCKDIGILNYDYSSTEEKRRC
ncbi:hypothetical protein scyTo_0014671 [Scyliorhinus torazame]|uniref:Uncharacterized protein n=1 Tax=Scyliorhinus torazame TaxID=75743 RepID=A0A401NS90_SCYTO|nr:hypothetical protein [Scyliorhinus torazame]